MAKKSKPKTQKQLYEEAKRETKRERQRLQSMANHPTAKEAVPYFPHAATKEAEIDILVTWASKLTMPALLENFRRMLEDPKGWKKDQKNVLLAEVYNRCLKHAAFLDAVMIAGREYNTHPAVPKAKKNEAARLMADTIIAYLDENF